MDNKRILVTGGAGFIGSHLCEKLLDAGNEVLCVDNYFTSSRLNITHLVSHPRFDLLRHDITLPLHVEVDQIYNLACPASPIHYQFDPIKTTKVCILGSINMLGLAKRLNVPILQASTSEVYGDPEIPFQHEGYLGNVNPIGPRACYDEGKRCAETLFSDYHREHNLSIKIARIFNTYGPRMLPNDGRVLSNLIVNALKGEPLTIYGDGNQTRSFCFVDDLVLGLIALMDTKDEVVKPINIGNPVEISILQLAKKIIKMTGSKSELQYFELPQDDPKRRCPDITLARKELNWEPSISLEDGINKTIKFFIDILENPNSEESNYFDISLEGDQLITT